MLPLSGAAPTTAERIRSACVRAGGALLAIERDDAPRSPSPFPCITCLHDGSFAIALPVDRDGRRAARSPDRRRCSS